MRYLAVIILALTFTVPAYAAFQGPGSNGQAGGFSGPGATQSIPETTVANARTLPDDAHVVLVGRITQMIPGTDDKYIFADPTGEIRVDIDRKDFGGQNVTPQNTVRIYGEVDKDFGKAVEIDVKRLEVIK